MLFRRRERTARAAAWRLSAKLLIASSVATVIGFSAICASVMLDMRRGEEQLARQMLENLAASIDADIGRNIELYDLSLRAVVCNMVMPELKDVSKPILHLILFDHAATAKHFGAIQVFDAQGKLTIDASTLDPRPENRADEEYFQVHRDNPDAGLFISRADAASWRLFDRAEPAHLRRGRQLPGRGRGLDPLQLFPRTVRPPAPRRGDTIAVLRRDRTIIMRKPFDLDIIGKNAGRLPGWQRRRTEGQLKPTPVPVRSIRRPRLYVRRSSTSPLYRRGRQAAGERS